MNGELVNPPVVSTDEIKQIVEQSFSELRGTLEGGGKFFPNGIGEITFVVSVGGKDLPVFKVDVAIRERKKEGGGENADVASDCAIQAMARSPADRIKEAKRLLKEGKVYTLGCSGFICAVLGISHEQANELIGDDAEPVGSKPPYTKLKPGNIVGWQSTTGSGHVALYVGESDDVSFIDVREPGARPRAKNGYYDHELFVSHRF